MKLILVVNGRVPGPRAHSITTVRTADALRGLGVDVAVWAPRRRGSSGADPPPSETARTWYGLQHDLPIVHLPCIDGVDVFPRFLQRFTSPILAHSFARAVLKRARGERDAIFVFRDPVLWPLAAQGNLRWAAEVHEPCRHLDAVRSACQGWTLSECARDRLQLEHVLPCAAPSAFLSRKQHERRARGRIVAYTGHLYEWKDPGRIARTAAALPDVTFRITGGFPADRERFQRQVSSSNVSLAGFVRPADVWRELAAADLVLATLDPSSEKARCFTSPLKIIEALAVGTPLVAPDLPSVRELTGDAAWLYDPAVSDEPAATIRAAFENAEECDARALRGIERARGLTYEERARRLLAILGLETPAPVAVPRTME